MKTILYIFLGGGAGSSFRYLSQLFINKYIPVSGFPVSTFIINLMGSLLIGILFPLTARFNLPDNLRLLLIVGFCGGFTTFSAFSNENLNLLKEGLYITFLSYASLSVFLGVAFTFLGIWIGKNLF